MRGVLADFRHAFRLYRHTPFASLIAIGVLAIGFAFVSAFLSLYVDLALRQHPGIEQGGRLVTIGQRDAEEFFMGLPSNFVERMNDEMTTLEGVAGALANVQQREGEEALVLELVSRDFFPVVRPKLSAGRGFETAEHEREGEPAAVISYRYWRDELGGADVVGTTLELQPQPMMVMIGPGGSSANNRPGPLDFRIVGIMAPEMTGLLANNVDIWLPFERALPLIVIGPAGGADPRIPMTVFGRRAPGASTGAVTDEIASRYPDAVQEFAIQGVGDIRAIDGIVRNIGAHRDSKRQLQVFLGASILLALVAAANVSLFLLARAPGRRRELGIRMSVGAPLRRLARQLASEAGLLVVLAALLGLVLSIWLSQFLRGLAFLQRVEWRNVTLLDWRVLGLAGIVLLVLTALVSLAPILGLKRLGIAASSRQVAARATLAQRFAGSAQIAIAGALGAAAIAFGWYLGTLMLGDPGYETRDRYAVQYSADFNFADEPNPIAIVERINVERIRLREAIGAIPGVISVAFGQPIPGMPQGTFVTQVPDPRDPTQTVRVTPGMLDSRFIEVLGLRLAHGRAPVDGDLDVVLVNQRLARELFGRDNVVGEQFIQNFAPPGAGAGGPPPPREIIGVLEDMSFGHPADDVDMMMFSTTGLFLGLSAVIESELPAAALHQELERLAEGGGIELNVSEVRPLAQLRSNLLAADRARGLLTIGTAVLVVLIAAFGFYGTQRYLVTAGRREYAIRASLGAGPRSLGRLVIRRGLMLGLPGLALGALLAFISVAWLRDDFVSRDISPMSVTVAVIAGLLLLLAAASVGPARQARQTQPAPLLRED